jgi:hypothetical protein
MNFLNLIANNTTIMNKDLINEECEINESCKDAHIGSEEGISVGRFQFLKSP